MTPFVAEKSIVAPSTDAFPLVNAKTVKVTNDVPSAFKVLPLELIFMAATLLFAVASAVGAGALAATAGALALPPPPPQPTSKREKATPSRYLEKFIRIVL
jgi:hypothetical protein